MRAVAVILLALQILLLNIISINCNCDFNTKSCVFSGIESLEKFKSLVKNYALYPNVGYYESREQKQNPRTYIFMIIKNSSITELPNELFNRFTNIQRLNAENCGIESLRSEGFTLSQSLKTLSLPNNAISKLNNVEFIYLKNIETIDLSHNQIESIHDGSFDKISSKLQNLNLSYNKIKSFHERMLVEMSKNNGSPEILVDLSHNEIEVFYTDKSLSHLASAKMKLLLNDNKLKEIEIKSIKFSFINMANNNINYVNLEANQTLASNNRLKVFHISSTASTVELRNNKISNITFDNETLSLLTKLDLSGNDLHSDQLEELTKRCVNVNMLDLSHNHLNSLKIEFFAEMSELQSLYLSGTSLSEIEFGLFSHQKNLKHLDLSNNNIIDIDFHVFSSLKSLTWLDLSDNGIAKVNEFEKIKTILPSLEHIGIEGNNWMCEDLSRMCMSFNSNNISLIDIKYPVKNMSSISGIKCTKQSDLKIKNLTNSSIDSEIREKFNEVIDKVNMLSEKMNDFKANESDYKETLLRFQSEILNLKTDKIKAQMSNVNYTNINEVRNLMEHMNNITLDRQKIATDQLIQRINELHLEIDKIKFDNEKLKNLIEGRNFPTLGVQASAEKFVQKEGVTMTVMVLGIVVAICVTLLIIVAAYSFKNYQRRVTMRMPRFSGRDTPNTVVTYDNSSI